MGHTRSWNLEVLDPRLSGITMLKADETGNYKRILKVRPWSQERDKMPDKVKTAEYGGFGPMTESGEKMTPDFDDAVKGATKQTAFRKFALATEFSEEIREDDLFGVCDTLAGEIGSSYNLTRELQGAQVYDNAFNTTYYTTGEGNAICSTTHDVSYGSQINHQNMLTDSESLSYSGVQGLLTVAMRQKDLRGYPRKGFKPGDTLGLLYQPEDMWMATTLFSPLSKYEPTSDKNGPNVLLANYNFTQICNEFQDATGTAATRLWFMINLQDPGVEMIDRAPLRTKTYTRDGDDSMVHAGRGRWANHVRTWRNIYGSGN